MGIARICLHTSVVPFFSFSPNVVRPVAVSNFNSVAGLVETWNSKNYLMSLTPSVCQVCVANSIHPVILDALLGISLQHVACITGVTA